MDLKNNPLAVLAIVAVIGVAGLFIMFNAAPTAQVAVKTGGQKMYGSAGMAYASGDTMACERLIDFNRVPPSMDYEAAPSEAVNRFGMNNCFDARDLIGYYCCNPKNMVMN